MKGKFSNFDRHIQIFFTIAIVSVLLVSAMAPVAAQANESTTDGNETATDGNESTDSEDGSTTDETEAETDETTTDDGTAVAACEPGANEPQMDQARLHASDTTIETDSPGRVSGGFQVSPTANCPVVVYITMSVPSGMTISGGSDFTSSGAGMVTTRFTVDPGANIKDIAAEVYSDETGERTVTADIQYWPEGHEDRAREIDGLSFTFDVEEPTTPPDESDEDDSALALAGGFTPVAVLVALLAVVALSRASNR